jgi:hypothetical protein
MKAAKATQGQHKPTKAVHFKSMKAFQVNDSSSMWQKHLKSVESSESNPRQHNPAKAAQAG